MVLNATENRPLELVKIGRSFFTDAFRLGNLAVRYERKKDPRYIRYLEYLMVWMICGDALILWRNNLMDSGFSGKTALSLTMP